MKALEKRERQAVVAAAKTWLRTPFHDLGRLPAIGADCAFVGEVYADAGLIPRPPAPDYSPQWHLHRSEEKYLQWVLQYGRLIPGPPQPGDMVLYRYGRCLGHSAIVVAWPTIIHAVADQSVMYGDGEQVVIRGHRPSERVFATYRNWRG